MVPDVDRNIAMAIGRVIAMTTAEVPAKVVQISAVRALKAIASQCATMARGQMVHLMKAIAQVRANAWVAQAKARVQMVTAPARAVKAAALSGQMVHRQAKAPAISKVAVAVDRMVLAAKAVRMVMVLPAPRAMASCAVHVPMAHRQVTDQVVANEDVAVKGLAVEKVQKLAAVSAAAK
jgi:hypothetical protein